MIVLLELGGSSCEAAEAADLLVGREPQIIRFHQSPNDTPLMVAVVCCDDGRMGRLSTQALAR